MATVLAGRRPLVSGEACTRRRWLAAVAQAMVGGTLAACGPSQQPREPATKSGRPPRDIEWWAPRSPGRSAAAAAWTNAHPATPMVMVPSGDRRPGPAAAAQAAGQPPALLTVRSEAITALVLTNSVSPLDTLVRQSRYDLKAFMPQALQPCYGLDGHLYALPEEFALDLLFFNRQFLHDAGIDYREVGLDFEQPRSTWEEFRRLASGLTRWFGPQRWGFVPTARYASLYVWLWQNGGRLVADDGRRATLDHPANVDALEWLASWVREQGGPAALRHQQQTWGTEGDHPLITGQLFALHATNRFLDQLARYRPHLPANFAPIPRRRPGAPLLTRASVSALALVPGSEPELLWDAARFLVAHATSAAWDQAEATYATRHGWHWLPSYRGQLPLDRYRLNERASGYKTLDTFNLHALEQARYARFPARNPAPQTIARALATAFTRAIMGQTTELESLRDAQRRAQHTLDTVWAARSS